jgi:hypothetical protein
VVADAATPDRRAEFFVWKSDTPGRYLLEVVLRDAAVLPAVVLVRYRTRDGSQLLVVPFAPSDVSGIGAPSAQVELTEVDAGQRWEVLGPIPADQWTAWDADTVAVSAAAAGNERTRLAWQQIGRSLGPELRRAVEEALG